MKKQSKRDGVERHEGRGIAEVPELPGCCAHGASQKEALANVKEAMRLWIDTAEEFGDPVHEPKGRRLGFAGSISCYKAERGRQM